MWLIVFTKRAAKDAKLLKSAGLDGKAKALLDAIRQDPFNTPPAYEALVGSLQGMYSRRINIQHRLVYEVIPGPVVKDSTEYAGTVKVLRMWTHYDRVR
ncbi:MAG TPA: Txe/YoeB family addiction module toxin [Candidatus Rubneribacter avistercoris]|nr:Txe/YoeB family addiction module toxin [Candidatus Rubneribacter avistercoris]